jgi:hypothetical protein
MIFDFGDDGIQRTVANLLDNETGTQTGAGRGRTRLDSRYNR